MARLIVDTRQVGPGQAPGSFDAPDASQGAQFASRQLEAQGQAVQRAGGLAGQIYVAEREKVNEARVNDALNRAQRTALDLTTEYGELRGEAALRVGEQEQPVDQVYAPRFERSLSEIADELKLTPVQRERYNAAAQPLALRFQAGAVDHFVRQNDVYQESVYTAGVATEQAAILADPNNAEVVARSRARITELTAAEGRRQGRSAEATALALQENTGKAFLDAIAGTADEDPLGAQEIFEKHRDDMTPAQQVAARNAFAGGIATQNAATWVASRFAGGAAPASGTPGGRYQAPVAGATIRSGYGPRQSFVTSNGQRASSNHDGVDFAAAAGTPVRAVAAGRVVRAGVNGGYGNFVEIDHGNGVVTGYAHLQDFDVKVGDTIAPGQNIARVGSTGNSTGPHLHLRARRNGQSIDPETLLGEEAEAAAAQAGTGRPTRAQLEREAVERFGTNPMALQAARAEISRAYSLAEAEERQGYEDAQDAAYRHIEATNTMPPASVMARLRPGSQNTIQNYLEARLAPPTVRSDPSVLLAIAANPEAVKDMSPEEIVANYGRSLSSGDLISLVGTSARANAAQRASGSTPQVVPHEAFSRAWNQALDLNGIDRSLSGDDDAEARQNMAQLQAGVRGWIIDKQVSIGRQLTEGEINTEVQGRIARLAWTNQGSVFGGGRRTAYATSYDNMSPQDRQTMRGYLQARGARDITDAMVYQEYVIKRVMGR